MYKFMRIPLVHMQFSIQFQFANEILLTRLVTVIYWDIQGIFVRNLDFRLEFIWSPDKRFIFMVKIDKKICKQ